jgi:hypothetical protein
LWFHLLAPLPPCPVLMDFRLWPMRPRRAVKQRHRPPLHHLARQLPSHLLWPLAFSPPLKKSPCLPPSCRRPRESLPSPSWLLLSPSSVGRLATPLPSLFPLDCVLRVLSGLFDDARCVSPGPLPLGRVPWLMQCCVFSP